MVVSATLEREISKSVLGWENVAVLQVLVDLIAVLIDSIIQLFFFFLRWLFSVDPAAKLADFFRIRQNQEEIQIWAANVLSGKNIGPQYREPEILRKLSTASGTVPESVSTATLPDGNGCYLTVILCVRGKRWCQLDVGDEHAMEALHRSRSRENGGNPQWLAPGIWRHLLQTKQ